MIRRTVGKLKRDEPTRLARQTLSVHAIPNSAAEDRNARAKAAGYKYYTGASTVERLRRTRDACVELGRLRFEPVLSDVDYLIFKLRRPIIEKWCANVPRSGLVVLDIGGRIQPYRSLLSGANHYYAIDLAMEGLVDVVATAEYLPFNSDSVDLILSNDTLQYIENPARAIDEMHRILRPGARLILSTRAMYPEHHDEFWRFVPNGLRHLLRAFTNVELEAEGSTAAGVAIALNVLLHRDIRSYRLRRIAEHTSIPAINLLGSWGNRLFPGRTRATCGYSVLAVK